MLQIIFKIIENKTRNLYQSHRIKSVTNYYQENNYVEHFNKQHRFFSQYLLQLLKKFMMLLHVELLLMNWYLSFVKKTKL